jgi:hypothetical protein
MEAPPATPKLSTYERLLQQEAEKAAKKRQAAGGDAAPAAPKPKARARAVSVSTEAGKFPFVAVYINTPYPAYEYSIMQAILPVNIPKLARKPAPVVPLADDPTTLVPMYGPGSADGQSIVFKVAGAKAPKGSTGPKWLFSRLPTDKLLPNAVLSTREIAMISERKSSADQRAKPLEPFTLVQVNNAVFEKWTGKKDATKQGYSLSCESLQPDMFPDFNEQPLEWRIAQILRLDVGSGFLKLDEVRALAESYRDDMATVTGDSKEVRNKKRSYMTQRYGNLIPIVALSANRPYKLGDLKGAKLRRKSVVPELVPLSMGTESSAVVRTSLEHVKPDIFRPGTTTGAMKIPDKMALSANFAVHVYDMKAEDPTVPVHAQYYPEVFTMAGSMVNFPIAYPEFIHQAFKLHPIPFQIIAEVNLAATLEDQTLDMPDKDTPNGAVHTRTLIFHAEVARYLRRQGIPCTRKFLLQRYGRDYASIETSIGGDKKFAEALRGQRATVFENWLPKDDSAVDVDSLLASVGCACFDGPKILTFPKEDAPGVSYFALNLFEFAEPPPTAAIDDAHPLLRPAVHLTPAEGDAFLLKNLPRQPTAPVDWVQKAPAGMPYYLFFAVADEQVLTQAVLDDMTSKLRDMMFPEGPVPGADTLPATTGDLRRRITCELLGLPLPPTPVAAAAATEQGEKRPRPDETGEDEPATKRPRLLDLMDDPKKEKSADDGDDDDEEEEEADFDE